MPVFRITGEIKKPRHESINSIKRGLATSDSVGDALFVAKSFDNLKLAYKVNKYIPAIHIYDKRGRVLKKLEGNSCPKVASASIEYVDTSSSLVFLEDAGFETLFSNLKQISGQEYSLNRTNLENYDYIIVYFWARYIPKRSKKAIQSIALAMKETKSKFLVLSVNYDYQDFWLKE